MERTVITNITNDRLIDDLISKIPPPDEDDDVQRTYPMFLPQVTLPYSGKTYKISFRERPPREIYMPRSRTFDDMLNCLESDDNVIPYDLTTEKEFRHAIGDVHRYRAWSTDGYVLDYLDIIPTDWEFCRSRITYMFTTLGSIFHGELKIKTNDVEEFSTQIKYDCMIRSYFKTMWMMWWSDAERKAWAQKWPSYISVVEND